MNGPVWRRLALSALSVAGFVYVCTSGAPGWAFVVALVAFVLINVELRASVGALLDPPSDPLAAARADAKRRHPVNRPYRSPLPYRMGGGRDGQLLADRVKAGREFAALMDRQGSADPDWSERVGRLESLFAGQVAR